MVINSVFFDTIRWRTNGFIALPAALSFIISVPPRHSVAAKSSFLYRSIAALPDMKQVAVATIVFFFPAAFLHVSKVIVEMFEPMIFCAHTEHYFLL